MREAKNGGGKKWGRGEDMQAVFLSFLRRGGVVILKQRGGAMLNLPTLAFYSSPFP